MTHSNPSRWHRRGCCLLAHLTAPPETTLPFAQNVSTSSFISAKFIQEAKSVHAAGKHAVMLKVRCSSWSAWAGLHTPLLVPSKQMPWPPGICRQREGGGEGCNRSALERLRSQNRAQSLTLQH